MHFFRKPANLAQVIPSQQIVKDPAATVRLALTSILARDVNRDSTALSSTSPPNVRTGWVGQPPSSCV